MLAVQVDIGVRPAHEVQIWSWDGRLGDGQLINGDLNAGNTRLMVNC